MEDYSLEEIEPVPYTMTVFNLSDPEDTHGDGWRSGLPCDAVGQGFTTAAENYARIKKLPTGEHTLAVLAGDHLHGSIKLVKVTVENRITSDRILSV